MSKVVTVAWREFKQTVLRKVFLLAILGIPILMVGVMALVVLALAGHQEPPLVGTIAIVDPSGEVAPAAEIEFDPKRVAGQQQKQVEEIAHELGFSDASAFHKAFRRWTGESPAAYRPVVSPKQG